MATVFDITLRARRQSVSAGALICAALLAAATVAGNAAAEGVPPGSSTTPPNATQPNASRPPAGQILGSKSQVAVHTPAEPVAEPDGYRMTDFRQPVPAALKGARVINTEDAEKIWKEQSAILIDVFPKAPKPPNLPAGTVWRDPSHMSIKGGHWLPNVGEGKLTPEVETYFRSHLETFTGGDKAKAIVFYCLKDCWMSWNAAKRAVEWGYVNVIWFPEGTDGWTEAGNDIVYLTSEP